MITCTIKRTGPVVRMTDVNGDYIAVMAYGDGYWEATTIPLRTDPNKKQPMTIAATPDDWRRLAEALETP